MITQNMKKFFANRYRVLSCAFVVVLVTPTVMFPVLKNTLRTELGELNENRNLAKFQRNFNHFGTAVEDYYNDHIPFRKSFIKLYTKIQDKLTGNISKAIEDITGEPPLVIENGVIYGKNDWLFYNDNGAINDYLGNNLITNDEMQNITDVFVEIDELLFSVGKKFVVQICPNKEQIYAEFMPNAYKVLTEYKRADRFVDYVRQNSRVQIAYAKTELLQNKAQGHENYYRSDTHHNSLGAYINYRALAQKIGLNPPAPENLTITEKPIPDIGDLASMILKPSYDEYSKDFDIDYNPTKTAKTVHVLGDSFFINPRPILSKQLEFMQKDFENVTYQHYQGEHNTANITDADVIVFEMVERMQWAMYDSAVRILETLKEIYG